MQTPAQRLGRVPPDSVLVHELGHMLVGIELGVRGASVEFLVNNSIDQARAWYSQMGLGPETIAARGIAGAVAQVKRCPDTIREPLRERLAVGTLFDSPSCLKKSGTIDKLMVSHGFNGDWDCLKQQGARICHSRVFRGSADLRSVGQVPVLGDV